MPSDRAAPLDEFLERLLASGGVVAASCLVSDRERVLAASWGGRARQLPARSLIEHDLFDLASLSKPFTATLALRLDAAGILPLDLAVGEVFPPAPLALARRTHADLLRHRAGFVSWAPLYRRLESHHQDEEVTIESLLDERLLGARAGTYSDLGYVLWGLSAQRLGRRPLGRLLADHVLEPLGIASEISTRRQARRSVACPLDTRREVELAAAQALEIRRQPAPPVGAPQDGNARFLGGYAGHAGLFGTAQGVATLAGRWLAPQGFLSRAALGAALGGGGPYALGWRRWTRRGGAGPALSPAAFGHGGFTGGSVWIDPLAERIFVLLAHRRRVDFAMDPWRRRFHRIAAAL